MRSQFPIALFLTLVGAGSYWYQATAYSCPAPLAYRVGQLDSDFNLSHEAARQYLVETEAVWEAKVDRDLFVYDEAADFTVDFVYDDRQESADSEQTKRKELDAKWEKSEQLLQTVETLRIEHQELKTNYEAQVEAYETRLEAYNALVSKYNDQGGAPAEVFAELETEQTSLNREAEKLTTTASKINDLTSKINQVSDEGNELVEDYNREVSNYNDKFGLAHEFTQGDYRGGNINVYKFSSPGELQSVLAHEFGHALGIDHVEDSKSLMYYLLEDTGKAVALSDADLAAYYEVCGTSETVSQKVRRWIRTVF